MEAGPLVRSALRGSPWVGEAERSRLSVNEVGAAPKKMTFAEALRLKSQRTVQPSIARTTLTDSSSARPVITATSETRAAVVESGTHGEKTSSITATSSPHAATTRPSGASSSGKTTVRPPASGSTGISTTTEPVAEVPIAPPERMNLMNRGQRYFVRIHLRELSEVLLVQLKTKLPHLRVLDHPNLRDYGIAVSSITDARFVLE